MATCQSCGSELTGIYCNTCGERAPEEKAARKPRKESPKATAPGSKGAGLFSPQRIWKTTATGLLALALFGGGMVTGFYMATPGANAGDLGDLAGMVGDEELPPIALAGKLVDLGVDYLNKGERSAAASHFRKALAQYEKAIAEDPSSLYARSYMGLTYYYVGDSAKAVSTLKEVLEKDPKYLWALFNLAWINQTGGKSTEAIALYEQYLAAAPTEKQNIIKYAEQLELIDRQVEATKKALEELKGGAGK